MIKDFEYKGSVISVWNDLWGKWTVCVDGGVNYEDFEWEVEAIVKGKEEVDELIKECYGSYEQMLKEVKEHEEMMK